MLSPDDTDKLSSRSHLFTLRMWLEDLGDGKVDWRGKVQHVNSGEARYFRDWSTLEDFLEAILNIAVPKSTLPDKDISPG